MAEAMKGKAVTLYLEPWQKRMLRDYVKSLKPMIAAGKLKPIKLGEKIIIDLSKPIHLNTYRVPTKPDFKEWEWEIYFTDAQKFQLQEVTGLKNVDSLHLDPATIESKTVVLC